MARTSRRYSGTLLDHVSGNILDPLPKPKLEPACTCRPPEKDRLGGQNPKLRWKDHQTLEAWCCTCGKNLIGGVNRNRAAVHALGLARMPLGHIDLDDLVAADLMLPEHREPPADPWVEARQHPRVRMAMAAAALDTEEASALAQLAQPTDLQGLAEPEDMAALARLVEAGSDFTDGAIEG